MERQRSWFPYQKRKWRNASAGLCKAVNRDRNNGKVLLASRKLRFNKLTSSMQLIDSNIPLNTGNNNYNIKEKGDFKEAYLNIVFNESSENTIYIPDLSLPYRTTLIHYRGIGSGTILVTYSETGNLNINVIVPDAEGQLIKSIYAK